MASSHKEHNIYYTRARVASQIYALNNYPFLAVYYTYGSTTLMVVQLTFTVYYTYGSTANFLFLGPTVLIYISKDRRCNEDLRGVGILKIERVIR